MRQPSRHLVCLSLLLFLLSGTARADEGRASARWPHDSSHRLGLEVTPLSPLIRIWVLHLTYALWSQGELTTGYAYMNNNLGDLGRANAHSVLLGYRHFFWRGLHAELELWPAYDRVLSFEDNQTYAAFDIWGELRVGYRFDLLRNETLDLYVLPQLAVGTGLYSSNPPPGIESESPFFAFPMVWIGIRAL